MSTSDHYQLLGVERTADRRTIRAAYRKALRCHHPDANAGSRDGEQVLLQVITAGRVLSDQLLRAGYDQQLAQTTQHQPNAPSIKKPPQSLSYQKLLLGCLKVLHRGKQACSKFFSTEQAKVTESRAAQQPKRNPPDFNFYLHLAISRNNLRRYQCGEDGVYRKAVHQPHQTKLRSWRKRTAVWILLGMILWRG